MPASRALKSASIVNDEDYDVEVGTTSGSSSKLDRRDEERSGLDELNLHCTRHDCGCSD